VITVPLTSDGIMEFVDRLHQAAANMNEQVEDSGDELGQQFRGPWIEFYAREEWDDVQGIGPRGVVALCDDIRSPLHIINATVDYARLARFNDRLRELWQLAVDKDGFKWIEPKPDTTTPGKSKDQVTSMLDRASGILLLVGLVWALGQARR
jgi:hypothetical protein